MAELSKIVGIHQFIQQKIEVEKKTYKQISEELLQLHGPMTGLSAVSVKRFCVANDFHRTSRLSKKELEIVLKCAVAEVGPTYGRKTMQGYLATKGVRAGVRQIGNVLHHVYPHYHSRRLNIAAERINPVPYRAQYFGHKLHMDQNEKLVMFGVTHICAIDGYSRKVVSFTTMPVKNNAEIYENVIRPTLLKYGLWDQIRVDHGKEWMLSLFVQELLADERTDITRAPHLQTSSKLNHMVERFWVEINTRVNYPIKAVLIDMNEEGSIRLDDPIHCFCVSWFTIRVANVGATMVVGSWNNHHIPDVGIPDRLMSNNNRAAHVPASSVPTTEEAVRQYERTGGHLNIISQFGTDPLANNMELDAIRSENFNQRYQQFDLFFHSLVNGNQDPFREGLLYVISITQRLSMSVQYN